MTNKDEKRWERLAALGVKREMPTPEGEAKKPVVSCMNLTCYPTFG
jgi:hypothetical protein